jgi:hypothetical protein
MNAEQVERAIERLGKLLAEIGWNPEQTQPGVFHIDFGPPHVPISTGLAAIIRETGQFVFYLNFGLFVSTERQDEVLQFISRANWNLIVGNFELDLDDGHLRVKSSLDFDGVELSDRLIRNAVVGAMRVVEAHADAIMKIVSS